MSVLRKNGVKWVVQRGSPPTMSALEQGLEEIKTIYREQFGQDINKEEQHEYSDGTSMSVVQNDDIKWIVQRGAPPTMSTLEQTLAEVKAAYMDKFGDVDAESYDYSDGSSMSVLQKDDVSWIVHRGARPTISNLLQSLDEAKSLYKEKFGEDVDEEERNMYNDGTSMSVFSKNDVKWIVHRGAPPAFSMLEQSLLDCKSLYKQKFGLRVDDEDGHEFNDGTSWGVQHKKGVAWIVNRGAPPALSALEQTLDDLKSMYEAKFGKDVEDETHEYNDGTSMSMVHKDSVNWIVQRGVAPAISTVEHTLQEVKALYKASFGQHVDEEEKNEYNDGTSMSVFLKDDVTWIVQRGAPPAVSALEQSLDEIKSMFSEKFGLHVDEEQKHKYTDGTSMSVLRKDGVKWVVQRGAPPAMSALEESLDELKTMYRGKFGQDVNKEEQHEYSDGTSMSVLENDNIKWIVHR